MPPPSLHFLICKMGPSIWGLCLPHSEDSRREAAVLTAVTTVERTWETGDAGVSGAGPGQGAVPALSAWERLRVTISLMRAGRPAGRESWARPLPFRPASRPDPRRLLSRVCGESGRV